MAREIYKTVPLDDQLIPEVLRGSNFTNETSAHQFIITCTKNNEPVRLTGSVRGRFIAADNTSFLIDGSIVSGNAVVTLHQDCYHAPGRFQFVIFNTNGTENVAIYAAVGEVRRSDTNELYITGEPLPDIDELLDAMGDLRDIIQDYDDIVLVQSEQPTSATNKIWIQPQADEYQVPTMQEHEDLVDEVADLKSAFVNKTLMQKCQIVTASSENRWDASSVSTGLLHTNGTVYTGGTYDNYCYYDIGAVNEGDVITSYRASGNTIVAQNMERVVAYDSGGNVLADSGAVIVPTYTVPSNVVTVKITANKNVSNANYMVLINAETAPAVYIPYVEPTEYYVATKDFIGEINIDADTDFDSEYLDFSMVNRVIPSECITGKLLNGVTGELSDNASYFVTGFMPIRPGETLYLYRCYTLESFKMRTIAAYDSNKNLIATYGINTETASVTYRDGMAYIRASILLSNGSGGVWQTPGTIMVVANSAPISTPTYQSKPKIKGDYTRKKVYVYAADSESEVIEKLVSAYNLTDCDVVFERSTYTFGTVLPNVMTLYGLSRNEIPIGNNCRYYFNGATLEAEIDLATLGTDFNCNLFGTQYKPTNFELHDGKLIATDTRYVVHDEAAALKGSYKHLYQNMIMEYHTNISADVYRKCIGGGTGVSGVIEIVGCKFTTDASEVAVSYHGNANDVAGAEFMLSIRDSWFSNSARAGELSTNQTGKAFLAGNSVATAFQTFSGWDVTEFNNYLRT